MHPEAASLQGELLVGLAAGQPGGWAAISTTEPHPSGIMPTTAIIAAAQVFQVVFIAVRSPRAAPSLVGLAVRAAPSQEEGRDVRSGNQARSPITDLLPLPRSAQSGAGCALVPRDRVPRRAAGW